MSPSDLIAATGLSKQNVDTTLHRMVKEGKIARVSRGRYAAIKPQAM
jgi:DNA-binding transcriptional regulator PaaX